MRWVRGLGLTFTALLVSACEAPTAVPTTSTTAPATTTVPETIPEVAEEEDPLVYRMGLLADLTTDNFWASLGPQATVWNGYVLGKQHLSLFSTEAPQFALVPRLAVGPPSPAVPDGEMWVVEQAIRDDVAWSDGVPLTTDDLVFAFYTVRDLGLGGNWLSLFPEPVVEVEAVDAHLLRIVFDREPGLAVWQYGMGLAPFMPRHYWAEAVDEAIRAGDADILYLASGVGEPSVGPLVYQGREPDAFIRSGPNQSFPWAGVRVLLYPDGTVREQHPDGTEVLHGGEGTGEPLLEYEMGPHLVEALYVVYSSLDAATMALLNGDIDLILTPDGFPAGIRAQIQAAPEMSIIANPAHGFQYLGFNMRRQPMASPGFRDALACMIDKEFIANDLLQGSAIPLYSLVPEGNAYWHPQDHATLCQGLTEQERLTTAVEALQADGFAWDRRPSYDEETSTIIPGEGLRLPDGTPVPEVELLSPGPAYDSLRANYALWIQKWAEDLGVPVTVRHTSIEVLAATLFETVDWDMVLSGWQLGTSTLPNYLEAFFHSAYDSADGGFNLNGYANPDFDRLAEQFTAATNVEEARALIWQMDALLLEDKPYWPLYTTPLIEAYRHPLAFPFTDTLGGLQALGGYPEGVRAVR